MSEVSEARAYACGILNGWGMPELADDLALVVSELVTNAVRSIQAAGHPGPVRLWLLGCPGRVEVRVWDGANGAPRPGEAALDAECGRGLAIVEVFSAKWGWYPLPAQHGGGKVAWSLLETATANETEIAMQEDTLSTFERVHLEKLRLACQVILDQAEEQFISDCLETELYDLRDQIDRVLLLPDRPTVKA